MMATLVYCLDIQIPIVESPATTSPGLLAESPFDAISQSLTSDVIKLFQDACDATCCGDSAKEAKNTTSLPCCPSCDSFINLSEHGISFAIKGCLCNGHVFTRCPCAAATIVATPLEGIFRPLNPDGVLPPKGCINAQGIQVPCQNLQTPPGSSLIFPPGPPPTLAPGSPLFGPLNPPGSLPPTGCINDQGVKLPICPSSDSALVSPPALCLTPEHLEIECPPAALVSAQVMLVNGTDSSSTKLRAVVVEHPEDPVVALQVCWDGQGHMIACPKSAQAGAVPVAIQMCWDDEGRTIACPTNLIFKADSGKSELKDEL